MNSEKTLERIKAGYLREVSHDVGFELLREDLAKLAKFRRDASLLRHHLNNEQVAYLEGMLDLIEAFEAAVRADREDYDALHYLRSIS